MSSPMVTRARPRSHSCHHPGAFDYDGASLGITPPSTDVTRRPSTRRGKPAASSRSSGGSTCSGAFCQLTGRRNRRIAVGPTEVCRLLVDGQGPPWFCAQGDRHAGRVAVVDEPAGACTQGRQLREDQRRALGGRAINAIHPRQACDARPPRLPGTNSRSRNQTSTFDAAAPAALLRGIAARRPSRRADGTARTSGQSEANPRSSPQPKPWRELGGGSLQPCAGSASESERVDGGTAHACCGRSASAAGGRARTIAIRANAGARRSAGRTPGARPLRAPARQQARVSQAGNRDSPDRRYRAVELHDRRACEPGLL